MPWRQTVFGAIGLHASATGLARFYASLTSPDGPVRQLLGDGLHAEYLATQVGDHDHIIGVTVNWTGFLRTDAFVGLGGLRRAAVTADDYRGVVNTAVGHRLCALAVAVLALAGCGAPSNGAGAPGTAASAQHSAGPAQSSARLVGPSEFAAAIAEPGRVTINVHVPYEGEIAGTDLSIPFDQITGATSTLPSERSTPLAIYCRSGRMTVPAAAALTALGYENVVDLDGGMRAWEASGRSLEWRADTTG